VITAWLTYCLLIATLFGAAAWVAERGARAQGWSGRWAWAVALVGSMGLPLVAWLRPAASSDLGSTAMLPMPGTYVMESIPVLAAQSGATGPSLDVAALLAWATASVGLLLYLLVSALRVRAEVRGWRRGVVDGLEVMVSERTGPAALGLLRGWVVLPEWALSLDDRLRRLLVLHEAEHVRAGDPQLAVAGLVTCALMPWNPVLWWQLARLRLAIEMDCDARVLRRSGDAASYGSLLLEVGQRRSRLAVGLAESRSMLERRLRMVTKTTTRRRTARALGLGAVSALVLAVACETPPPTGLADTSSQPLRIEETLAAAQAMTCPPMVVVDGERASGLEQRPFPDVSDIASVDVIRMPRAEGEPEGDCSAILVLTHGASPEAMERTRRVKETLLALEELQPVRTAPDRDVTEGPTFTPMTVRPALTNVSSVQQALADQYPPLLREAGIGGSAMVWLFIDEAGVVQQVRLQRTSGYEALDAAALRVARTMEFTPAYNRDVRVPVWVAVPVTFGSSDTAAATTAPPVERAREVQRRAAQPPGADDGPVFTPMTVRPQLSNEDEVRDALRAHYPPLLRSAGIGGTASIWVHIDAAGTVTDARLQSSSGYEALDQAALRVARTMAFQPARNRDEPVPVWVAIPITFAT
jgi:TonB family protein